MTSGNDRLKINVGPLSKNTAGPEQEDTPWEADALGRRDVAVYLTPFLASLRQPFVISIDAPYGGGKSYFLHNWKRDLDNDGFVTVYFNAWETDYSTDPLLAFVASINHQLAEKDVSTTKNIKKATLKKLTTFGPRLISKGGSLFAKALTRRYLGDDGLEEVRDILDGATEEDIAKELGKAVDSMLSKQAEQETAMEGFRVSLASTIQELITDLPDDKQKMIVFVDELDRCRPDYAVQILESIKHFFAVEGIVFVLGIDEKQVANAMSAVYGPKLDTDGYLRRFIDWRFRLPKPTDIEYAKFLGIQFGFDQFEGRWGKHEYSSMEDLFVCLGVMSEALGLSLRQQEQNFTEINLLIRTLKPGLSPLSCVVGFLVPLRAAELPEFEPAFTVQTPGPMELNEVRALFEVVRKALTAIGGLNRIGRWQQWHDLEGCFLAWFVTAPILGNIRANTSSTADKVNALNNEVADHDLRQQAEYERNMWSRCFSEAEKIHSELFPNLGTSLADTVLQRLNNAGAYLIPSADET